MIGHVHPKMLIPLFLLNFLMKMSSLWPMPRLNVVWCMVRVGIKMVVLSKVRLALLMESAQKTSQRNSELRHPLVKMIHTRNIAEEKMGESWMLHMIVL
jgi:hypothetical protein